MPANPALRAGLALCTPAVGLVGCHCVAACAGLSPRAPIARNLSSRSSFALYSTYSLIHRHCRQPRIVRRVVRHDPRPVHPGGPVNDGSFRRAIGADKTVAATPACFLGRAARAKQKNKTKYPAAGRQNALNLLLFFPAHSFQPEVWQSQ